MAAAVLAVVVILLGWLGYRSWSNRAQPVTPQSIVEQDLASGPQKAPEDVETIATENAQLPGGGTPMAQRVAVVGLLNKRNGDTRDLTLKPGQAIRAGDVIVRMRACEQTAPWEDEQLTGSFVQVDVRGTDQRFKRVFSGWLFKERPALNVVRNPVYDVWTKSCTMSWPESGADTVAAPAPSRGSASRAKKPAEPAAGGTESGGETTPSNAADSKPT